METLANFLLGLGICFGGLMFGCLGFGLALGILAEFLKRTG